VLDIRVDDGRAVLETERANENLLWSRLLLLLLLLSSLSLLCS
jgi:hypothetical protein